MHCGGMLQFGPDGLLYISTGDDSSPLNSQDLNSLHGKILRIDTSRSSGYAIPKDNPFAEHADVRKEIWAYGLRNPWRFSIDPDTGYLWAGDVGDNLSEEINQILPGSNSGWPQFEGNRRNIDYKSSSTTPITPVLTMERRYRRSVIVGGEVYRGKALPNLRGAYLYADFINGKVFTVRFGNDQSIQQEEIGILRWPTAFGRDASNELYIVTMADGIYRIEEAPKARQSQPFPRRLSQSALFLDTKQLIPSTSLISYEVISPRWSDGARAKRWIKLPASGIHFYREGHWDFPKGTALIEHFEIDTVEGDPSSAIRLETRVLQRSDSGQWRGYSYRWNNDQTDAVLDLNAATKEIEIQDPQKPNELRKQTYSYPSSFDCLVCHNKSTGFVLGIKTLQLNREIDHQGISTNQLTHWKSLGLFRNEVDQPQTLPALVDPSDERHTLNDRARSYLDTNCAHCHQPGGPTNFKMDLRFAVSTTKKINYKTLSKNRKYKDFFKVHPGHPMTSILLAKMLATDKFRMPPLASNRVDPLINGLFSQWFMSGLP